MKLPPAVAEGNFDEMKTVIPEAVFGKSLPQPEAPTSTARRETPAAILGAYLNQ